MNAQPHSGCGLQPRVAVVIARGLGGLCELCARILCPIKSEAGYRSRAIRYRRTDSGGGAIYHTGGLCNAAGMASIPPRDLAAEVAKHFHGSPRERLLTSLRLGEEALTLFLATQPPGASRREARFLLQRNKNRGRRFSAVMQTP